MPRASIGSRFGLWYSSGHADGMAPTGPSKKILDLYHRGRSTPLPERLELGKDFSRAVIDTQHLIDLVDGSPTFNGVVVVRHNFRNVPLTAPSTFAIQNPGIAPAERFFFDD